MGRRRQDGFTMVELLVVISVIAMLVAILLPAVNMAHEAARNTQCKNNLKQVATAVNQYQGRLGGYPGFRSLLDSVPVSWVVRIAPDLDERSLHSSWQSAIQIINSGKPAVPPTPYIGLLACPSDATVDDSGPSLSYMANAGRAELSLDFNMPQFGVFLDQVPRKAGSAIPGTTEAFLTDQGDGLGKTLMIAENVQLFAENRQTATRWDVPNPAIKQLTEGNKMSNVVVWHATANPTPAMTVGGDPRVRILSPETARPASAHAAGANVAFCDTRVTFLRNDVSYQVYCRLMAPHDEGAARIDPESMKAFVNLAPLSSTDYE